MIERYKESVEEFKRADHLFHVSLKYTRTVDVIRSVIERIISTIECSINSLLKCMKEEKIIEEIPENPVGKAELVLEKCEDEDIRNCIQKYLSLRKLMRAPYTKREEFRRHVTMVVNMDGETVNVDIDCLKEYYDNTRDFLTYLKGKVEKYKE